jgi:2-amino-4,5-dihydroxy-6-oxo-7-(phosphooxy)heptanoate synthase
MTPHTTFARMLRLQRLYHHGDDRLLVVPLDHPITDGPIVPGGQLDHLIGQLAENGADVVVVHKGSLRHIDPARFRALSLLVHLSAGTCHASDPDARRLVSTVEEAMQLGADGVSIHVNMGSLQAQRQLADLGRVARHCARWNVPLLAMVYPRGPHISNPAEPTLVAQAVAIAVELGADLVKTVFPGSAEAMAQVRDGSPIPVLVAGGPVHSEASEDSDIFTRVGAALAGGAAGVAVGRRVG